MFDLRCVQLTNFKSYAGEHTFDFPEEVGLYFLTGKNIKEPRLESNGAGKSTILDAVYWCLYGKTLRGLKGGDVTTWGEDTTAVTLDADVGGELLEIKRTQSPNTLTVNGTTVDQETLTGRLCLTPDAFAYSVMMPQHNQSFFELTPSGKLTLFAEIMGLDHWLELSQQASKLSGVLTTKIAQQERQVAGLDTVVANAIQELEVLRERELRFDTEKAEEIEQLKARLAEIELDIEALTGDKGGAAEALAEVEQLIEAKTEAIDRIKNMQGKHTVRLEAMHTEYLTLSNKLEAAFAAQEALGKLGASCPTCFQEISGKHLKTEQKKALDVLGTTRSAWKVAEEEWQTANKFLRKAVRDQTALSVELTGLEYRHRQAERAFNQLKQDSEKLKAAFRSIEMSITTEEKSTNPYTALYCEKEELIQRQGASKKKLITDIENLNAEQEATEFWVGGFKRLRLFIIEETLRTLEIEVNNSLTNLGLVGWRVEFDVERENKSGGVTKGFVVFVTSPGNPEPVRWEAWSGGEAQRLQLAGDLGLANLIMQQAGLANTIEFYDEPSKHLSKAGLMDLAETLHQRAVDDGKRILLVDHNMPEFGEFAGVITVTKDEHGSAIE